MERSGYSEVEETMDVSMSAITSLAAVRLQAKSRLFLTACCPDKDLVVIISKAGSGYKMSLWKMQGSKKWEVDLSREDGIPDEVTALNWGPDGQTIVVGHSPPRLSLHSLQNGREETSLFVEYWEISGEPLSRITGIWWFKNERKVDRNQMPDMFKRGNLIPGSALSLIKSQPLLDPPQDDTVPLNASDLFAFQDRQARTSIRTSSSPEAIILWPSLPYDPLAAGISPSPRGTEAKPGVELDEKDLTNADSLLVVTDDTGQIHLFLDGSYPLGAISLGSEYMAKAVMKNNEEDRLFVHAEFRSKDAHSPLLNSLIPLSVELPLLNAKSMRHVAENCSAARELAWYTMRVVKEMKKGWFGGDGHVGARQYNANYVRGLQERQSRFDQELNAVLDLTVLLATGKSSPALSDFNQTGELTSERGLQKWETAVGEALLELRDYSETRVAPACQRLHLLLEEVRGWSLLPQLYGKYGFSTAEIDECLDLAARAIILSAWLAATARKELNRFAEFQMFLRYETSRLNATETTPIPRHDILEVNEYLMSGLVVNNIDKWFIGPVPQFPLDRIAPATPTPDLRSAIDRAREFASDPTNLTWPPITQKKDLSHVDRNLDALVHALAEKCQKIYYRAAKAVARTTFVRQSWTEPVGIERTGEVPRMRVANPNSSQLVRRQAVCEEKSDTLTEHLAVRIREGEHEIARCRELLCIIRVFQQVHRLTATPKTEARVAVALLDCKTRSSAEAQSGDLDSRNFHIFDMDFFDEQSLVIVYQSYAEEVEQIGIVDYNTLEYFEVDLGRYVNGLWQEDIVAEVLAKASAGEVACPMAPIRKHRALKLSGSRPSERNDEAERASLAVNGRAGRRVACVLGGNGIELEMLDMEGEEELEEELEMG